MSEVVLVDLIEAWLHGPLRRISLRFPPALEARFEAETRLARNRMLMTASGGALVVALSLYYVMLAILPDVAERTRLVFLSCVPFSAAMFGFLWFNPAPLLRESAVVLGNAVIAGACLYLFSISHSADSSAVFAAVAVLLVTNAIGTQLRFPFAMVSTLLVVGAFAAAVDLRPGFAEPVRQSLKFATVCIAFYGLFGTWRAELEHRRLYLLGLKDRVHRHDAMRRTLELDELTRRDPLTGLANRRAYDTWLATIWSQQEAVGGQVGLIVIDVDRFKEYNDFCGHDAGDNCLKKIAVCLRDQLRGTSDQIARIGGEAFGVVLPGLSEDLCADIAERLRAAVQRMELPHLGLGVSSLVTVSAGVASHAVSGNNAPSGLYQAADTALYQAKIFGRNRVCIATLAAPAILSAPVAG
jgi:diguanylate cyclase (GGDEF)-like protein